MVSLKLGSQMCDSCDGCRARQRDGRSVVARYNTSDNALIVTVDCPVARAHATLTRPNTSLFWTAVILFTGLSFSSFQALFPGPKFTLNFFG